MHIEQSLYNKIVASIPIAGVLGIVLKDGKILLGRRNVKPEINKWTLPGGRIEKGELLEDAVLREIKEETGFDVEIIKFLDICQDIKNNLHAINIVYLCKLKNNEQTIIDGEFSELIFFNRKDILSLNIGFNQEQMILEVLK